VNSARTVDVKPRIDTGISAAGGRRNINREEIAAIVDKFLSKKIGEAPKIAEPEPATATGAPENPAQTLPPMESPVRTVIHELKPQGSTQNGTPPEPVDFVSEDDVRRAIAKGEKIYINAKSILTPSARDLGEEKEIFARIS
jgi:hypothetical protein